jgi:predicted transposase YbfD/YdcC
VPSGRKTVAPALSAPLDRRGRVLTGDALFCQRHLCQQVLAAGGDYLLLVKEHQPTLHEDIRLLFEPPAAGPPPLPLLDRREALTVERGHGRTDDRRHLIASTDLTGYSDWPGLAQVFRRERTWREQGTDTRPPHYVYPRLPPADADAARLLALKRGHWGIENRLHYVKDVVLEEDGSQVRLGAGPTVLATLRDTALSLLRWAGCQKIAERLRAHSQHPAAAVALLLRQPPQNA